MRVDGVLLGKFCTAPPTNKLVSSTSIDVYFHSDAYANDIGFVATYILSDRTLTTMNLTVRFKRIYSELLLYNIITKTCQYHVDPLKSHFYIVNLGFTGVNIIFLFLLNSMYCGYSLELPHQGGSNEYTESIF